MSHQQGRNTGAPLEKDFSRPENMSGSTRGNGYANGGHQHLHGDMDPEEGLKRIQTAGSISISPELFEKIYLSPESKVKGDLRKTFANPTPLALIGFLISLSPLSADLMGWRAGTGGPAVGSSGIGNYYFFGGLLMILGGLGEYIIGNTFPFVVFSSFGAFWLGTASTLQPFYSAYAAYSPDPSTPALGAAEPGFLNAYGYFEIAMGLMCFLYMILSIRTNFCFFMIFLSLVCAFALLAAARFHAAMSNAGVAFKCQQAAGAFTLVTVAFGWWIFFAIMLAALDFPFQLPVGDLSHLVKGASEKKRMKRDVQNAQEQGMGT